MSAQLDPFLKAIWDSKLLDQARFLELQAWAAEHNPDPSSLAKELNRRGWLTPFQVKEIYRGRGSELTIGPFVLLELLGEGGMGRVFKAQQTRLGRIVALKVIRREKITKPQVVLRFHQEITAASKLSHPNVAFALDADEADGVHYFAMEYVEGIDLTKLVRERGQLPFPVACEYIRQAAIGLQHAFEKGLVHRDVKPSNLIVTPKGQVKVLDLGLAMLYDNPGGEDGNRVTQEGLVLGTPDFLAPEQAQNPLAVDIRADVYALGATLYYLLTARVPYDAPTPTDKLLMHVTAPPPSLLKYRPDAPPQLDATIQWFMAKRPEDRPQTPAAAALALQPFCPIQPLAAPQTASSGYTNALPYPAPTTWPPAPTAQPPNTVSYLPSHPNHPATASYPPGAVEQPTIRYALTAELQAPTPTLPDAAAPAPLPWQYPAPEAVAPDGMKPTIRIRERPESAPNQLLKYGVLASVLLVVLFAIIGIAVYAVPAMVGPLSPPEESYANDFGMKMVLIKPGQFVMGSTEDEPGRKPDEGPAGSVSLTQPFYMSVTEVSFGEYYKIAGKSPPGSIARQLRQANQAPVHNVTWTEAVEFCQKLNQKDRRRRAGWSYRLPTEAEWEYACRAGSQDLFSSGRNLTLGVDAIFDLDIQEQDQAIAPLGVPGEKPMAEADRRRFHPVGSPRQPNAFGLFDMHGNVWEWCQDYYEATAYSQRAATDPTGPETGHWRVARGGSCQEPAAECRSASRKGLPPETRKVDVGFRVVLAPERK